MGRLKNDAITNEDRRREVATLGDVVTAGHDIFCWCNRCGHNSEVPSANLIARLGPAIPVLCILSCLILMTALPAEAWLRFVVWSILGLVIYFAYGKKRSALAR